EAAHRGVAPDRGTIDAAADYRDVEALGEQTSEMLLAILLNFRVLAPLGQDWASAARSLLLGIFLERIALLRPGIAMAVISANFPESASIIDAELDGSHPLRALPAVKLRHDQAQRPSMLRRQIAAVMLIGQHDVVVQEFLERQVSGITAVA